VVAVVGVLAGACGGKANRPATRPEALAACMKGCLAKVKEVAAAEPSPEQRKTCDQTCGCIVEKTFLPSGEQRANGPPLTEVAVACAQRFTREPGQTAEEGASEAAGDAPNAAPPSSRPAFPPIRGEQDLPPKSKLVLGRALIPGTRCAKARLPRFGFDEAHDRAWLIGEEASWHLPMTWNARVERPDLLKVWGPPSRAGVFSVIELFVAQRCEGYDTLPVYERLAARGLIGLNRQADTAAQVRERDWVGRLGGNAFATEIASPVVIETSEGTKTISLYVTQVVETKSYAVFAAGVCPVDEPPGSIPVMCKSEYSALSARK